MKVLAQMPSLYSQFNPSTHELSTAKRALGDFLRWYYIFYSLSSAYIPTHIVDVAATYSTLKTRHRCKMCNVIFPRSHFLSFQSLIASCRQRQIPFKRWEKSAAKCWANVCVSNFHLHINFNHFNVCAGLRFVVMSTIMMTTLEHNLSVLKRSTIRLHFFPPPTSLSFSGK